MSEMKTRPGRTRAPVCPNTRTTTSGLGTHVPQESKKELREMERNDKKRQSYRKNFKKNQGRFSFIVLYDSFLLYRSLLSAKVHIIIAFSEAMYRTFSSN